MFFAYLNNLILAQLNEKPEPKLTFRILFLIQIMKYDEQVTLNLKATKDPKR